MRWSNGYRVNNPTVRGAHNIEIGVYISLKYYYTFVGQSGSGEFINWTFPLVNFGSNDVFVDFSEPEDAYVYLFSNNTTFNFNESGLLESRWSNMSVLSSFDVPTTISNFSDKKDAYKVKIYERHYGVFLYDENTHTVRVDKNSWCSPKAFIQSHSKQTQ